MGRRDPDPDEQSGQGFIAIIIVGLIFYGVYHYFTKPVVLPVVRCVAESRKG